MKLHNEQHEPFQFWIGSEIKKIYIDSWSLFKLVISTCEKLKFC